MSCECKCSVSLLQGALIWSAVYDCGIFLIILTFVLQVMLSAYVEIGCIKTFTNMPVTRTLNIHVL